METIERIGVVDRFVTSEPVPAPGEPLRVFVLDTQNHERIVATYTATHGEGVAVPIANSSARCYAAAKAHALNAAHLREVEQATNGTAA